MWLIIFCFHGARAPSGPGPPQWLIKNYLEGRYAYVRVLYRDHKPYFNKGIINCEILGYHIGIAEDSLILACYGMSTGEELPTF